MRRNEVTPELIELSKTAKELGFPQEVEVGMWVRIKFPRLGWETQLFDDSWEVQEDYMYSYSADDDYKDWFLLLSFSRCLEWLRENKDYDVVTVNPNENPHVEIAEAVVKMLES